MLPKKLKRLIGRFYTAPNAGDEYERWERIREELRRLPDKLRETVILDLSTMRTKRRDLDFRTSFINEYGSVGSTIVNAWTKRPDRESWTHVLIVAGSREDAEEVAEYYLPGGMRGHDTGVDWDCSGRPFHNSAWIRKLTNDRWIITQYGGLDV